MSGIDLDQMEKLMSMLLENDITELEYCVGDLKIELKRGLPAAVYAAPPAPAAGGSPAGSSPASFQPAAAPAPAPDQHAGQVPITSPMVGTFYSSPDPESSPYVTIGSQVTKDTTVCLIEAMKVYNEIKAEVDGVIERIAVKNADPVEYGQPLFFVRPT